MSVSYVHEQMRRGPEATHRTEWLPYAAAGDIEQGTVPSNSIGLNILSNEGPWSRTPGSATLLYANQSHLLSPSFAPGISCESGALQSLSIADCHDGGVLVRGVASRSTSDCVNEGGACEGLSTRSRPAYSQPWLICITNLHNGPDCP